MLVLYLRMEYSYLLNEIVVFEVNKQVFAKENKLEKTNCASRIYNRTIDHN